MTHHVIISQAKLTDIVATVAGMAASLAAAVTPAGPAETALLDDARLRLICLAGSIGGAWLAIHILPENANVSGRAQALKMFTSTVVGFMYAPWCIYYFGIEQNVDKIVAVAGLVAFLGVSVLKILASDAIRAVTKWFREKAGLEDEK